LRKINALVNKIGLKAKGSSLQDLSALISFKLSVKRHVYSQWRSHRSVFWAANFWDTNRQKHQRGWGLDSVEVL